MKIKNTLLLIFLFLASLKAADDEFGTNNVSITVELTADERWALRRYQAKQRDPSVTNLHVTNYFIGLISQIRTNTLNDEMAALGTEGLKLFSTSPTGTRIQVMNIIGLTNLPPSLQTNN